MKLTPSQELLLLQVRAKDQAWRDLKQSIEERVRAQIEEGLSAAKMERDLAVRAAFNAGVPKTQIGQKGLKTSDPNTVYKALSATENATPEVIAPEKYTDLGDGIVRVELHDDEFDAWIKSAAKAGRLRANPGEKVADFRWDGTTLAPTADYPNPGTRQVDHPAAWWIIKESEDAYAEAVVWCRENMAATEGGAHQAERRALGIAAA